MPNMNQSNTPSYVVTGATDTTFAPGAIGPSFGPLTDISHSNITGSDIHWSAENKVSCNDIIIDGQSLTQSLNEIKEILNLITRDLEREKKYQGLRDAANEYKKQLEKYKAFDSLKDSK